MSGGGWIKLHRELIDKPIWKSSTPEQKVILITLLCMVNHEPKQWIWKGETYTVEPGQTITSIQKLADACGEGVTNQKTRTALEKFEKLEFLTSKSTNHGRLITIENWGKYQSKRELVTNDLTDSQQTGNKQVTNQLTTNKNIKNVKNDKERERGARARAHTREGKRAYGRMGNVYLTDQEHEDLCSRFERTEKLIDQISYYLANARKDYQNHAALIWKIAEEDHWPRRKEREPDPVPRELTAEDEAERERARAEAMEKISGLFQKGDG